MRLGIFSIAGAVAYWVSRHHVALSVIVGLDSDTRAMMSSYSSQVVNLLDAGVPFQVITTLTPEICEIIFLHVSKIIILKNEMNISFEMFSCISAERLKIILANSELTIAQKAELIKSCQPTEIINATVALENNGQLQSTIRTLWKETRRDNVSGLFSAKTSAEITYRAIQKICNEKIPSRDRACAILLLIRDFAKSENNQQQPFAVALKNKFLNIESLSERSIEIARNYHLSLSTNAQQ